MSQPVKEFWKSVNIRGSYGQEFGVLFFLRHSVYKEEFSAGTNWIRLNWPETRLSYTTRREASTGHATQCHDLTVCSIELGLLALSEFRTPICILLTLQFSRLHVVHVLWTIASRSQPECYTSVSSFRTLKPWLIWLQGLSDGCRFMRLFSAALRVKAALTAHRSSCCFLLLGIAVLRI